MTAATIAPGKRAAKWNPGTMRHSWTKEREHHRRCDFCGLHVENRPGGGGYFQLWDWPAERGLEPGTNRRDKAPVPKCPGPYVAPTPAVAPAGVPTCPKCSAEVLALVPLVIGANLTAQLVALAGRDPEGDFVVEKRGDGWTVHAYRWGETVDPAARRSVHKCSPYRYQCSGAAGKCPRKGRQYATGAWCDDCVPRSR